jgi:hypothetical protein
VTFLVFAIACGILGGVIGRTKGSSFFLWFLISGCVPVIGLLAAIFYRTEADEPRRVCPGCGRVVKLHDALCTRCGTELEWTDDVVPPESALVR